MSDEKKGKVFLISMTVIIVLLFLSQGAYPKYKAGKYDSESIDQIYAEDTQDGSYESFIRLMESERDVMNEGHAPGDHSH